MSLTVQNLTQITSGLADTALERSALELADKHVTMFLKRDAGGVFFGQDTEHHETIGRIAKGIQPEPWDRLQSQIGALDKFVRDSSHAAPFPLTLASEAITETLALTNRAAFYFGLALALRLIGGAR